MCAIRTQRLILREWREDDLEPFAALNADPTVMEYFPAPLTRSESDALVDRICAGFQQNGFGLWAVEAPGGAAFIGFVGLSIPSFEAPFTPCVEVGWRLAKEHWGKGYATEAAVEALRIGFRDYGLAEICSWTAAVNLPSIAVMQRIGMTTDPREDFGHPRLPDGHRLQRHVLYRISR